MIAKPRLPRKRDLHAWDDGAVCAEKRGQFAEVDFQGGRFVPRGEGARSSTR